MVAVADTAVDAPDIVPSTADRQSARVAIIPGGAPRRRSWLISVGGIAAISLTLLVVRTDLRVDFVLVTALGGILIAPDAIDWARGRLGMFDPVGLIGVYGVYYFFMAPLMTVLLDYNPYYVPHIDDKQQSLAMVGLLHVVGLMVYRAGLACCPVTVVKPVQPVHQSYLTRRLLQISVVSVLAYLLLIAIFAGPVAYYQMLLSQGQAQNATPLSGLGPLVTVAAMFPLTCFIALVIAKRDLLRSRFLLTVIALVGFAVVLFLVDGFRGSRGSLVWPLVTAVGAVHYLIRPIRRVAVLVLIPAFLVFMLGYGLFKSAGVDGLSRVGGGESFTTVAEGSGRSVGTLLLGDFSRTTTQALVMQSIERGFAHPWAMGTTYVGDVLTFLPGELPIDIETKVHAGTETVYGTGSYDLGLRSTLIYGMVGEGVLNFGLLGGAVLPFVALVVLVRWALRAKLRWEVFGDVASATYAGGFAVSAMYFLFNDLDNYTNFMLSFILPTMLAVFLARRSRPIDGVADRPETASS